MERRQWALPVALGCFILRQPLMSMAGPATSELTMAYVGERNRELMSACNGAIWSGAWWLAARIFELLRAHHFPYWQVFLTTAALYLVGTFAYLRSSARSNTAKPPPTIPPHCRIPSRCDGRMAAPAPAISLALFAWRTGFQPVRADSASRLSANESDRLEARRPSRRDACPPAKQDGIGRPA